MNATAADIKEGYKLTKVGLIPKDWKIKDLESIGGFLKGKGVSKSELINSGLPCLTYGELYTRHHDVIQEFVSFISEESANNSFKLEKGDILFAGSGETLEEIGKCAAFINDFKAYAGGDIVILRQNSQNAIFLGYLLNHEVVNRQKHKLGQGHSVVHIYSSSLRKVEIPLPPILEQHKIAEILSTWDQAIQKCEQTITELKIRNNGLAKELLTGKKRLRGFTDEWQSVKIGEVTKKFSNRNKELIDARIYSVTNTNGFVLQSDHFSREVAGDDLSNYKTISKGDFAYNPARINVGSIAYFEQEQGVISSLYVCFRTTKRIEDKFLYYWLSLEKTIHDFGRFGEGGVRIYLWYELFAKIKLVLPSIEEQKAIISVLDEAHDELKLYEKKSAVLQEQKKGLMQKLLTGEIRVNVK
ncbi:MAG: restriction endonuclease subunit S [Cyclobacteriaceae bacterium]|jgi:type I restriction enzyme S subunit|nr:restriction endonuclease subunit S [Cyclobacteriaceae bacterium]